MTFEEEIFDFPNHDIIDCKCGKNDWEPSTIPVAKSKWFGTAKGDFEGFFCKHCKSIQIIRKRTQ